MRVAALGAGRAKRWRQDQLGQLLLSRPLALLQLLQLDLLQRLAGTRRRPLLVPVRAGGRRQQQLAETLLLAAGPLDRRLQQLEGLPRPGQRPVGLAAFGGAR